MGPPRKIGVVDNTRYQLVKGTWGDNHDVTLRLKLDAESEAPSMVAAHIGDQFFVEIGGARVELVTDGVSSTFEKRPNGKFDQILELDCKKLSLREIPRETITTVEPPELTYSAVPEPPPPPKKPWELDEFEDEDLSLEAELDQ